MPYTKQHSAAPCNRSLAQPLQTARKVNRCTARKTQRYIIGVPFRHPTNVPTHEGKGWSGKERVHSQRETTQPEGHGNALQRIGQQHNGGGVTLRVTHAMSAPKPFWGKHDSASVRSSSACFIFLVEINSSASAVGGQAITFFLLEGGTTRLSRTGSAPNVSHAISIIITLRLQLHNSSLGACCRCSRPAVAPPSIKGNWAESLAK